MLRHSQRRTDAREQLLDPAGAFAQMGARPWQGRAEAELRATRATAPVVKAGNPLARLTPQELQFVRLATGGSSNKQIGAQLFLSPRTVGFQLWRAFGQTRRRQPPRADPLRAMTFQIGDPARTLRYDRIERRLGAGCH